MNRDYTPATDDFIREVRQVLEHLYDPETLRASRLSSWLMMRAGPMPLTYLITSAIQALKPSVRESDYTGAWRIYRALQHRYVEQFSQQEVAENLSISVRQLRREEHSGLLALSDYLWREYMLPRAGRITTEDAAATQTQLGHQPEPGQRAQELDWLRQSAVRETVDVTELIQSILAVVRPLAEQLHIQFDAGNLGTRATVLAHEPILRQALVHALSSAVRSAPGGVLGVDLGEDQRTIYLTITIAKATAEPAGPLCADDAPVIRELLNATGGVLEIHGPSRVGEPCRQVILLEKTPQPRKVLMIDDNPDTLLLYRRYLQDSEYEFTGIKDPSAALPTAQDARPDVIVLDVMLPDMDGWELLGRLAQHPATQGVPIVVCSILPEEHLALALGAAAFLQKPVSRAQLLQALDQQTRECRTVG